MNRRAPGSPKRAEPGSSDGRRPASDERMAELLTEIRDSLLRTEAMCLYGLRRWGIKEDVLRAVREELATPQALASGAPMPKWLSDFTARLAGVATIVHGKDDIEAPAPTPARTQEEMAAPGSAQAQ